MNEEDHTQHLDESVLAELSALVAEVNAKDDPPKAEARESEAEIDLAMLDRLAAMAEGRIARPTSTDQNLQPETHPDPSPIGDSTIVRKHPAQTLPREMPVQQRPKSEAPAVIGQVSKPDLRPLPPIERSEQPWRPPPRMVMPVDPAKVRNQQRSPWRPIAIFSSILVMVLIAIVVYLLIEGLPWGQSSPPEAMTWTRP